MAGTGPPNARSHACSHDRKSSVGVVISIPSRRSSPTYQVIPHPSRINVLGTTDADFLVIPHRKLGARQLFSSSLFGKRKRQVLVLVQRPFGPTQEPFAERHVDLNFALLTEERVILDAHKGVEREQWERKLVRMSELVLRLDECGTLSIDSLNRRVQRNERRIELRGKL